MVDNFKQIRRLIGFQPFGEDIFYFCQILKRKKEHPNLGSNSYVVKTYYLKSFEDFDFHKDEMICLARFHDARVYISLNPRSFEKTAFQTLKKVTDQIMNKDYKSTRKAFSSVCGMYSQGDTSWIIDIDGRRDASPLMIAYIDHECEPISEKSKILAQIPTKNGIHLITKPFRLDKFKEKYPDIDVHKNNPTLMFCP